MAGHIYAFINELSFQGQFKPDYIVKGLLEFLRSVSRIKDIQSPNYTIMYYGTMYQKEIAHGISYASALRNTGGEHKDEVLQLKMSMDRACWQKLEDVGFFQDLFAKYSLMDVDVSNSSLAEAYEYEGIKEEDDGVVVINLSQSTYGANLDVKKVMDDETRTIRAMSTEKETIAFLCEKGFTMPYDRKSTKHPLPEQTILGNTAFFVKTQRKNVSEYLYERIGHNELWCLDDFHFDGSAHFEIFSMADDTWKGESYELQAVEPDYTSKKHKGSKIRG